MFFYYPVDVSVRIGGLLWVKIIRIKAAIAYTGPELSLAITNIAFYTIKI